MLTKNGSAMLSMNSLLFCAWNHFHFLLHMHQTTEKLMRKTTHKDNADQSLHVQSWWIVWLNIANSTTMTFFIYCEIILTSLYAKLTSQ